MGQNEVEKAANNYVKDNRGRDLVDVREAFIAGAEWQKERSGWIRVDSSMPNVNTGNVWDNKAKVSIEVFTFSSFGIRKGRYVHPAELWVVDGVTSSEGINVTHWMKIEPPII